MSVRHIDCLSEGNESLSPQQPDRLKVLFISRGRQTVTKSANGSVHPCPASRWNLFGPAGTDPVQERTDDGVWLFFVDEFVACS